MQATEFANYAYLQAVQDCGPNVQPPILPPGNNQPGQPTTPMTCQDFIAIAAASLERQIAECQANPNGQQCCLEANNAAATYAQAIQSCIGQTGGGDGPVPPPAIPESCTITTTPTNPPAGPTRRMRWKDVATRIARFGIDAVATVGPLISTFTGFVAPEYLPIVLPIVEALTYASDATNRQVVQAVFEAVPQILDGALDYAGVVGAPNSNPRLPPWDPRSTVYNSRYDVNAPNYDPFNPYTGFNAINGQTAVEVPLDNQAFFDCLVQYNDVDYCYNQNPSARVGQFDEVQFENDDEFANNDFYYQF
ncbi:MAG: hypothetical protein ACRDL7_04415 [Gaiellaceae bacterium]